MDVINVSPKGDTMECPNCGQEIPVIESQAEADTWSCPNCGASAAAGEFD